MLSSKKCSSSPTEILSLSPKGKMEQMLAVVVSTLLERVRWSAGVSPAGQDGTGEGSHTEGSKSWKDEWRGSRRTRSEKDKWVGREAHPFPILMRTTGLSRKGDGSPPFSQAERPPNKTAFLFTSTRLMSLAFLSVGS